MQSLQTTSPSISMPNFTRSQWDKINARAEEYARKQEQQAFYTALNRSQIPTEFREATIPEKLKGWAENPTSGLVIYGSNGTLKTTSACAILIEYIRRHRACLFTSFGDIFNELQGTFGGFESSYQVLGRFENCHFLCLDDVGKERITEWNLPIIFSLIDKRISWKKHTIITTNFDENGLVKHFASTGDIDKAKAIASRLKTYTWIELSGKDRRIA